MPESIQHQHGSGPFMAAVRCMVWGFDLGVEGGIRVITDEYNPRCSPPWADWEIRQACENATKNAENPRGWLLAEREVEGFTVDRFAFFNPDDGVAVPLTLIGHLASLPGETNHVGVAAAPPAPPLPPPPQESGSASGGDPDPNPVVRRPGVEEDDPAYLARWYLARYHFHPEMNGLPLLRCREGLWFRWQDGRYKLLGSDAVTMQITNAIDGKFCTDHEGRLRSMGSQVASGADVERLSKKRKATGGILDDVQRHARAQSWFELEHEPAWLDDTARDAKFVVAFENGILDLPAFCRRESTAFRPPTPRFFTQNRLGFAFHPNPPRPVEWERFLASVWPNDPASIACLQEWFGYLITADTSLHKILLLLGPSRAGKGTICNVLERLVGSENTVAVDPDSLVSTFGLEDLVGKSVGLMNEARFDENHSTALVSRMLSISGGDKQRINQKHKKAASLRLTTRFVLTSNEVPAVNDPSGVFVKRLVPIRFTETFEGKEDNELLDRLLAELPGIFCWAVKGWERLRRTKSFTATEGATQVREQVQDVSTPVAVFVDQCCRLEPEHFETTQKLFDAYMTWCKKGNRYTLDIGRFGAGLSAVKGLKWGRPRIDGVQKTGYTGLRLLTEYERGDFQ